MLHICPLCDKDPNEPNLLKNRKALLIHLRGQHCHDTRCITVEIQTLFGITLCTCCELYYNTRTIKNHVCRPGVARKAPVLQNRKPSETTPAAPPTPSVSQMMTKPSQISDELVDRLTGISFDEIFQTPSRTITEIHHSSVKMWAQTMALLLDGIMSYAFGLTDPETVCKANAFLKLFLMAPRLLLSSSRGVAHRARLLLTGTQETFDFLLETTRLKPKPRATTSMNPKQQDTRIRLNVSKLIQSCDLSRAMNALETTPPLVITPDLTQMIRELHPIAAPEHCIPASAPTKIRVGANERLFQQKHLERVIKDLRTHAAPDMTGLRPSHLKSLFRGRREQDSPEARCRLLFGRLIHRTLEDPDGLGPSEFWENFAGGKLSVIARAEKKPRPVGCKHLLYKLITSIQGRAYDKALVTLAGPAHLAGKPNGVLAAAIMAQMELDYMQRVAESSADSVRCILTTDAEAAFQSASRKHCYDVLCSEETLKDRFAPFFAHTHKGAQRVFWPEANTLLRPSSGFTQGDINSSKLFTCNTASLVAGLQAEGPIDATVVAIVDDITIMGTLDAVKIIDSARERLQKPANYQVNLKKQYVYTMNEDQVAKIQTELKDHKVIYVGNEHGFMLSGIPLGGDIFITAALQSNLDKTLHAIANIAKLKCTQEKLILLLQCIPGRIQHLLAAVPMHISRDFARHHDEAIMTAVADVLDLGTLTPRDRLLMQRKISDHGLGLRSMEANLEFLFLAGFMKTVKSITTAFPHFFPTLLSTLEADSGYGRQLADALETLRATHSQKLLDLLPGDIKDVLKENYVWPHDAIQRELDDILAKAHDDLYDLTRIGDQQDKATLLSTDTSIFLIIPRSGLLRMPNEHLVYLARQLFGKPQRRNISKFCPNTSSTGTFCGAPLDSRDLHIRTCKMTSIHHQNHAAIQQWFEDLARQAHIQTTPAPPISDVSERNPTKQLAADLMLIDVSLREPTAGKDGGNVALDFSMVTSAAMTYCGNSAALPLHAAGEREKAKMLKYADAYKEKLNIHFIPVVFESGGAFGVKAQDVFGKICNLITQSSGQSSSAIAYFWKSRLLVTLASINYRNVQHWAQAHTKRYTPDSVQEDMMDYYDHDERERKQMQHSSGPMRIYRAGPDEECGGDANDEDGNAELVANYYHNVI